MSDIIIVGDIGFSGSGLLELIDSGLSIESETDPRYLFANRSERINNSKIILVDLDESEWDGVALIESIRRWNPLVAVLGYTSSRLSDAVIRAMKAGAYSVEPKTSDPGITAHYIGQIVADLDLFGSAQRYWEHTQSEARDLKVAVATELSRWQEFGRNESETVVEKLLEARPDVLIVEDECALRTLIHRLIAKLNGRPVSVGTGAEAVGLLATMPSIGVAVLDIGLPDTKGYDLIPEVLTRFPEASVAMLTAFTDRSVIMNCFKAGATDYLTKPFHLVQFNQTLTRMLMHQRIRQFLAMTPLSAISEDMPKGWLEELAVIRAQRGDAVLVKEVCLFYPELRRLGLAGDEPVIQLGLDRPFQEAFQERLMGLLQRIR